MPTDCGLKPPIEVLPQIAQARDIVLQDSEIVQGVTLRNGRAGWLL
jgi:hypothetical protein